MSDVLLINPRRRRSRKAQRSTVSRRRRRNPVSMRAVSRRAAPRKRNPSRRLRNPFGRRMSGMFKDVFPMLQNAAIGAAGSIAVDAAMGQINQFLPDMVKVQPGRVGVGEAVKALITVALGQLLSKATRRMSVTAAQGALAVQADRIVRSFLPPAIRSQLAYATPALVMQGTARINPNTFAAYTRGRTPLLNAYTRTGGPSPLLSSARTRESVVR